MNTIPSGVSTPAPFAEPPATLWYRLDEKQNWVFNHLEDGHCETERPTPKCDSHKRAWSSGQWRKEHVRLSADVPAKVLHG